MGVRSVWQECICVNNDLNIMRTSKYAGNTTETIRKDLYLCFAAWADMEKDDVHGAKT